MNTVLFQDSWMIIVAKDAGTPVQTRDLEQTTLIQAVRRDCKDKRIQPVHRIDQPVSGTVVLGRDSKSIASLHRAFSAGDVRRLYLAVVATAPDPPEGTLHDYLGPGARTTVVSPETPGAREARLKYRTLGKTDHHTIILVELCTGRHHQIRAQLAHRGWHVVGDARYGARRSMRDRSIALHAWRISVPHPAFPNYLSCSADLPDTPLWRAVAQVLRRSGQENGLSL